MISAASRPYIDASVPVLREHGLAITTMMYANMLAAHPELTNIFNMANQANGKQQRSLAAAVFAYASNIDHPDALVPVISRIAHKHASLGIKPAHYPIVGRYLIDAIRKTLGDAATPALLSAWDEAYNSLASVFIGAEKELYALSGVKAGITRAMRIVALTHESEDVSAITLGAEDGAPLPDFKPGQYVSCTIVFADGSRQLRQYSLSDAPNGDTLRISVKRERALDGQPAGQVSNWIHEQWQVGATVQVSPPYGDFTPDTESNQTIVLLSAGIGITPMIATLNQIAATEPQRHVIFGHAARSPLHHAHQADLAAAQAVMPNLTAAVFYEAMPEQSTPNGAPAGTMEGSPAGLPASSMQGFMDTARLPTWPRGDTDVYLCGPDGFMRAQWQSLVAAGVPVTRLHREVFGPDLLENLN